MRGFAIQGGDGTELLQPGEEIFDRMASAVKFPVILSGVVAIGFRGNRRDLGRGGQRLEDTVVGILREMLENPLSDT